MVNHNCAKFGGHTYCSGGYIKFSVVEVQDSTYPCLNQPLLFTSETLAIRPHGKPCSVLVSHDKNINKSNRKKLSNNTDEKENEKRKET